MDLKLVWTGECFDISLKKQDIELDHELETVVWIMLFTDKRAPDTASVEDKRGYWYDEWGSHLWLLLREVLNDETLRKMESYSKDALKPLITDKLCDKIEALATKFDNISALLDINLIRGEVTENYKYNFNWQNQKVTKVV